MLLVIKLTKLDAFACFSDASYIVGSRDPFSFHIVYASITPKSALSGLDPCRKGASSSPV